MEIIVDLTVVGIGVQQQIAQIGGQGNIHVADAAFHAEPGAMRIIAARVAAWYTWRRGRQVEDALLSNGDSAVQGLNAGASVDQGMRDRNIAGGAVEIDYAIEAAHIDSSGAGAGRDDRGCGGIRRIEA